MYCRNCGCELEDNVKFCSKCGAKTNGEVVSINSTAPVYVNSQNPSRINGFSTAGFVLSFFWFLAILGLIFSILGYRQAKRENTSKGLAIAGIVISAVCIVFFVLIIILSAMMTVV